MGILRRKPKTIHGVPVADIARETHKDQRGIKAVLDQALEPGERIVTFFKSPGRDVHPAGLRYLVIASRNIYECRFYDEGDVLRYPLADLRGLRAAGPYVRLGFGPADGSEIVCVDFFLAGEFPVFLAFYGSLAATWSKLMGREFDGDAMRHNAEIPKIPVVVDPPLGG